MDKAIWHYAKILGDLEGRPELADELALFNKLGDLYVKLGNITAAVEQYEKAINHYAEQGFPNNAIALCNKVLRNAPGRTHIYLRLAKLMMQRGFASEAKQNLLEYAERMQKAGKLEDAFLALKEFADLSPENAEIRLILADQLQKAARTDEAREQLAKLYNELQESGNNSRARATLEKMRAIDPEYDLDAANVTPTGRSKSSKNSDIIFLDLDDFVAPRAPAAVEAEPEEPIEPLDLEPTSLAGDVDVLASAGGAVGLTIETSAADATADAELLAVAPIEGLDVGESFDEPADVPVPALEIESTFLDDALDVPEIEPIDELPDLDVPLYDDEIDVPGLADIEELDFDVPVMEALDDLPLLDVTAAEDTVEDIELDMPWDVGEGDSGADEPEEDGAVSVAAPENLEVAGPDISTLEFAVADDPDLPGPHRELGEALIEAGDRERGMQELDYALEAYQAVGDVRHALDVLDEILRLDPNSVSHHQQRVEFALQQGENAPLIDAYLELADALIRCEGLERARFVYETVLERDPGNDRATFALETLLPDAVEAEPEFLDLAEPAVFDTVDVESQDDDADEDEFEVELEVAEAIAPDVVTPEAAAEPAPVEPVPETSPEPEGGGFVDLGALIFDEEEVAKDTRMRIDHAEPPDQQQQDFAEMLSEFKKGIDANIDADDAQAHYDLGVAFKEMGLLDEAISEFQKALRGSEDKLRTSESLGICFFEKGQFAVAATVLRRAVESEGGGDDDAKIGLLYWLGRSEEKQGRNDDALGHYQRIFSIDINFQDVGDRVNALTDTGG